MESFYKNNIYIVLVHYPVLNKNGEIIISAVTNLDLHDIARVSKTYAIKKFYIVTPVNEQIILLNNIIDHWTLGEGSKYNSKRKEAMKIVKISRSFADVLKDVKKRECYEPKTVVTTARSFIYSKKYSFFRKKLNISHCPHILVFGTAWGLSNDFLKSADYVLDSINGVRNYNHLSVRSAVSIVLDRLLGCWP